MSWREVRTKGRTSTSQALFCSRCYLPVKYYTTDKKTEINWVGKC